MEFHHTVDAAENQAMALRHLGTRPKGSSIGDACHNVSVGAHETVVALRAAGETRAVTEEGIAGARVRIPGAEAGVPAKEGITGARGVEIAGVPAIERIAGARGGVVAGVHAEE